MTEMIANKRFGAGTLIPLCSDIQHRLMETELVANRFEGKDFCFVSFGCSDKALKGD